MKQATKNFLLASKSLFCYSLASVCCDEQAGFVDAQVFMYLWPVELYNARICIISGDSRQPVISVFESPVGNQLLLILLKLL